MNAGPKLKSKEMYREDATEFEVGIRAFDRAWAAAIINTGKTDWERPGRRS